jgi:nicotinate-nucleotide adenylyltransferase
MEFFRRHPGSPRRLGIFPGAFNPPTVAHVELVRAALCVLDEVLLVLPRAFPHKNYMGATLAERVEMLDAAFPAALPVSIGSSAGGLFVEIAEECRTVYGEDVQRTLVCGADAAERILSWDYGRPGAVAAMLQDFDLLVADRGATYLPPEPYRDRIQTLLLDGEYADVSATEIRERILSGKPWQHLIPPQIFERTSNIFGLKRR